MARPKVVFHFEDSEGKRAQVRLYPAGPEDYGAVRAWALELAPLLMAVSDARLRTIEIVMPEVAFDGTPALPSSDASTYSLLFYRNGSAVASIRVPSAGRLPTEVTGPYAGIRHSRSGVELSGLLGEIENLASGLVDRLGRPYPTTFSVGGRVTL